MVTDMANGTGCAISVCDKGTQSNSGMICGPSATTKSKDSFEHSILARYFAGSPGDGMRYRDKKGRPQNVADPAIIGSDTKVCGSQM